MSGISYSPLASSQTEVFAGEKGKRWRFFVEATAVRERPTLVRKINRNGGSVVNSALEADVLLAEHNTKEALELFEAWHSDKILLSTRWVARCLEEQAFLGRDRGWAGCELTREVLLQGIIVGDEDAEEDEEEMPQLPKRPRRPVTASPVSKMPPSKSSSGPGPSNLRTSSTTSLSQTRTKSEQNNHQKPSNFNTNIQHSSSQLSGNSSLYAHQTSTVPTTPIGSTLQSSLPSSQATLQQQQAFFATILNNLMQPSQPSQQPLSQDMYNAMGQYSNFSQVPPLTTSPQNYFSQQFAVNPLALNPRPTELAEQLGPGNIGQQLPGGFGVASGSTKESSTRPTPEDVDTDLVSDIASVTSEEVELSVLHSRKGKGRTINDSSSDVEVQTAIRSNPPRKEYPPKRWTGIFVDGRGKPRRFYIMVDIKNRKDLLKIIRKHNGAIITKMDEADYIILNNRSNQFQKALGLLPKNKLALSPTWLEECDDTGKIAKTAPHVIDEMSGVGHGASRRKSIIVKARASVPEECESEEGAPGRVPNEMPRIEGIPGGNISTPQARSQSPLPPRTITPASKGKNLFTEEDRTWFFNYARFKLEHDPLMTNGALMRAIAHKAPHHPLKSWANNLRTKWRVQLDALKSEICGRAGIALTMPSSPTTPRDKQGELLYPETSPPTPIPSQSAPMPSQSAPMPSQSAHMPSQSAPMSRHSSLSLPTSVAFSSHSSQAESICTTSFKRKEHPSEDQLGMLDTDQPSKKLKTPMDIIDVDSLYMDGWDVPV